MANAWGLPDNELKQIKSGLGIADVSAAPAKPVRKKAAAAAIPGIGDTPDMKPYRFMNAQELADEGAGPIKSLVGGFSGSIANTIAGDKEGKLWEYTSPEARERGEVKKISDNMAGNLGVVKGRRVVIPGITSVAEAAEPVAKAPAAISNIAANAALGAAGGDPAISSALKTVAPEPVVSPAVPTAAQTVPAIGDPGSGSALVSGKKINYQDIGGIGDPLKPGHDGSGQVAGQAQNSNSIVDDMIARQDQGIVSQAYKDQVANAVRINAANGMAPTAEQMKTLGMSNTDLVNVLAANNKDGRYDTQITDLQKQQIVDQQGQKLAIDSQALENDLAYKNSLLAIDAPLKEAQAKNNLAEAKAREFAISPEGVKQKQAADGAEESKKDAKELVKTYYDSFKKLNLPADWAGKHMELAKKYAMAADPSHDYGLYFNPGTPNSMGIGVKKSLFDPLIQKYRKAGYPDKDAMAHAMGDLKALGAAKGIQLYEDVPNLDRLPATANKPVDNLGA